MSARIPILLVTPHTKVTCLVKILIKNLCRKALCAMGIDMCGSIMQCTVCGSIFTGPRCLWGPVYGSRSLYLCHYKSFVDVTLTDDDTNSIRLMMPI